MSWANRATLILGLLWALPTGILSLSAHAPLEWLLFVITWGIPIAFVWIVLRLVLGSRGAVYRERPPQPLRRPKPRRPGLARDASGNVIRPFRPDNTTILEP